MNTRMNKQNLPAKTCLVCQRPFTWRKNGRPAGMKYCIVRQMQEEQIKKRNKMMVPKLFPTDMASILARLESVDPVSYAETRNFTDGRVSRLSPHISRGVISLKSCRTCGPASCNYNVFNLLKELAWRNTGRGFGRTGAMKSSVTSSTSKLMSGTVACLHPS